MHLLARLFPSSMQLAAACPGLWLKEKWRVNQHFREGVGDRDAILVAVREVVGALAAKDADEAAGRWRGAKMVEALGLCQANAQQVVLVSNLDGCGRPRLGVACHGGSCCGILTEGHEEAVVSAMTSKRAWRRPAACRRHGRAKDARAAASRLQEEYEGM